MNPPGSMIAVILPGIEVPVWYTSTGLCIPAGMVEGVLPIGAG